MSWLDDYKLYKHWIKHYKELKQQCENAESKITYKYTVHEFSNKKPEVGKICIVCKIYDIMGFDMHDVYDIETSYCDNYSEHCACKKTDCPYNKRNAAFVALKRKTNLAKMCRNSARSKVFNWQGLFTKGKLK